MINVGDKVRLTGEDWHTYGLSVGTVVEVDSIEMASIWAGDAGTVGNQYGLYSESNPEPSGDYSCELVTDTASENFAKTAAKFATDPLSTKDIEALTTLGDQLGISSFDQNVHRILTGIADVVSSKNLAYGDSALNPVRIFSRADRMEQLFVRLDDKLSRVQRGHEYPGDDTIRDIIGYCTLILIARESA